MKSTELKKSLEQMSVLQLQEKLDTFRSELFSLRLSVSTAHVKNYAQFGQLRKDIARVLTLMRQKNKNVETEQG